MLINWHTKKKQKGFTLIELVVSMGLFLFVLTISMGSLLSTVQASRKASTMRIAMDNLNLAMEDMSRSIRQGYTYHCGIPTGNIDIEKECIPSSGGSSYFAFEPFDGDSTSNSDQTVYTLNGSQIEKSFDSGITWYAVTSPNIEIDTLIFYYSGPGGAIATRPFVTIIVHGSVGGTTDYASDFTVQTSIAQRSLGN